MKYKYAKKPDNCPECGSERIAKILYGMPAFSDELKKQIYEGQIVLGGCCITEDDPVWRCVDCDTEIYRMKIDLIDYVN